MHYRSNELKFQTSKDDKRELEKLNGTYSENLYMYVEADGKTPPPVRITLLNY